MSQGILCSECRCYARFWTREADDPDGKIVYHCEFHLQESVRGGYMWHEITDEEHKRGFLNVAADKLLNQIFEKPSTLKNRAKRERKRK